MYLDVVTKHVFLKRARSVPSIPTRSLFAVPFSPTSRASSAARHLSLTRAWPIWESKLLNCQHRENYHAVISCR